jgi:hypothetical protein
MSFNVGLCNQVNVSLAVVWPSLLEIVREKAQLEKGFRRNEE